MKRIIFLLGVISFGFAQAQERKVGINTDAPREVLDVNGTIRVQDLPLSNKGKVYDGNVEKKTVFNPNRTIVADAKGVLGYVEGIANKPVVKDEKSTFAVANRCVRGTFSKNNNGDNDAIAGNIAKESVITLDGMSVRYNIKTGASTAKIQIKAQGSELVTVILSVGAAIGNGSRFATVNSSTWTNVANLNYDTEEYGTGVIVRHNTGDMYRYTALGWKQNASSISGFCHSLEKIGKWDGILVK